MSTTNTHRVNVRIEAETEDVARRAAQAMGLNGGKYYVRRDGLGGRLYITSYYTEVHSLHAVSETDQPRPIRVADDKPEESAP